MYWGFETINLVSCTYMVNAIFDDKTLIFCNLEIDEKMFFGRDLSSAEGVKAMGIM